MKDLPQIKSTPAFQCSDLLSGCTTSATSSTSPQLDKDAMLEAIKLLTPPPENPFVTIAKKNGFNLEAGDKMIIHALDVPHEAFDYIHKNLVITEHIERGNIYFSTAEAWLRR